MSIKVSPESLCQNGAFQCFRPVKALMLFSQRRNLLEDNQHFGKKIKRPGSWSENSSQNIELQLTCKKTYLKDTSLWSDMQYDIEDTIDESKYFPPKKRFLEKAEMEADSGEINESNNSKRIMVMDPDYLGVSTKCLKETILQYRNAIEAESNRSNTKATEFLFRTFGSVIKNNNLDTEKNKNLSNKDTHNSKAESYYRSGFKKFTLRRIEEDSNDSNSTTHLEPAQIEQAPEKLIEEPRGKKSRACKGVRYQQFMNDTLSKRQNKKMGPKNLPTLGTITQRRKGRKKHLKEANDKQESILCVTLPAQSRRETRNSIKAATALQKKTDESNDNNTKIEIEETSKDETIDVTSNSIQVIPKKRFRTEDYNCKEIIINETKRLSSPVSSDSNSSRLSSPESNCSNNSTLVHYKKRVSRTFVESQNDTMNCFLPDPNVNLQTLADVALRSIPF
ncbi:uncharacterized protein LOC126904476 [Daktulosphaira vitifoliae]|uniref:uncharacterized protein LOC126904476 n=1 Tax=Daktulosphaira vitifoliae TaxID=58002 RepID=UPI0021AA5598|nr:uncharacterized protein LOC126904476 [Daktulosphaira vitifoliae]XP_050539486.1 uncharacterized protein LOC126904476 [Daktulosphaira vitifoliae]XP_050539487.1 uncharacterized protein LOC126904476 [Daktulosphaira vitifoliae]XP_050539488.1 uncharacterized protein LOC126904476 [Daktulosphaira vitifoliae]XP_050539489.1 uncharacterized protein LOC126904476 [Daktulosphaira vitifoliae]XP_050539490.1 uncharacterized protein LOC126904476 [Daktulosphaira vitifoliae]XP_050539491.1 uncharacterized prot